MRAERQSAERREQKELICSNVVFNSEALLFWFGIVIFVFAFVMPCFVIACWVLTYIVIACC